MTLKLRFHIVWCLIFGDYVMNWEEIGSSVVVTNLYAGSKFYQGDVYGVSGIVEVSSGILK